MDSLLANYASSDEEKEENPKQPSSSKLSLSTLPPPKSHQPRRVVQFKPPINPYSMPEGDEEEDKEEEELRERKRRRDAQSQAVPSHSGKSSLLSLIPAPKNSLSLGSARRSTVLSAPPLPPQPVPPPPPPVVAVELDPEPTSTISLGYNQNSEIVEVEMEREMGIGMRELGRRGKPKIVEIKQEELTKNRPRPNPSAVSFGPSYPAVSAKGKPSKLHKRKHQIGSLYFDMKQKEMELSERRSKGFLTKAETQAKYGW